MDNSLFDFGTQRLRLSRRDESISWDYPTLPAQSLIQVAEASLPSPSDSTYLSGQSQEETLKHIVSELVPALNGQGQSGRYYGFVTGGVLPIAEWADNVVSHMDQNVQVHLPTQTVATTVEDAALEMLADLLQLGVGEWKGKTFTTGATASNILGLACGREAVIGKRLGGQGTVGDLGLLGACLKAGITEVQVLTSAGHSSLSKAASVVGFGRLSVKELRLGEDEPWRLNIDAVERELQKPGTATIIAISAGEVNTGRFALTGIEEMTKLRSLADRYGAWIHVDGGEFISNLQRKVLIRQRLESSPVSWKTWTRTRPSVNDRRVLRWPIASQSMVISS